MKTLQLNKKDRGVGLAGIKYWLFIAHELVYYVLANMFLQDSNDVCIHYNTAIAHAQ